MEGQLDAGKMKGEHVQGRETDSATSGFTKVCDRMMGWHHSRTVCLGHFQLH